MSRIVASIRKKEHDEQVVVVDYCRKVKGWLIAAVPNGAHLASGALSYKRLKAEGLTPGFPDLILPYARRGYHCAFIEMKVEGNRPTEEQTNLAGMLRGQGHCVATCYGSDEAIRFLEWYMSGSPTATAREG